MSLRSDPVYANLDRECRVRMAAVERAISRWLALPEIGSPEERRLKREKDRAEKAYATAQAKRLQRRTYLFGKRGIGVLVPPGSLRKLAAEVLKKES